MATEQHKRRAPSRNRRWDADEATAGEARSAEERSFLQAFGLGLKLERVTRGLTQEEFADLIGVHRTFEGQLERGQRGINLRELPRIARALGKQPADLLPSTPPPTERPHESGTAAPKIHRG